MLYYHIDTKQVKLLIFNNINNTYFTINVFYDKIKQLLSIKTLTLFNIHKKHKLSRCKACFTTRELSFIENNSLKNEIYYQNPNHNFQGSLESKSTKAMP